MTDFSEIEVCGYRRKIIGIVIHVLAAVAGSGWIGRGRGGHGARGCDSRD